ncbi:hypothetical protein ABT001_30455 [Streptomyces sp. NPDC002793]|uniref:hypothetical protein n=1 Tax=Streptomyces sp. NPDC002793 TaxID=3154432 RepID=UPI00332AC6E3
MNVDREQRKFDLIASMYAVVHGEATGPRADILTAQALTCTADHQGLLTSISPDEEAPPTTAAPTDSFCRFFQEGLLGRNEKGGYISFRRLHAARTQRDPGDTVREITRQAKSLDLRFYIPGEFMAGRS